MSEEIIEDVIEEPIEEVSSDEPEVVEEVEEKEPEKVPKGVQKRIDEITREKYEERRERQAAQERADRLERELAALRQAAEAPKQAIKPEGAPNPDDYDAGRYDPEYLEALTDWKVKQLFDNQQKQLKIAEQQRNVITLQEEARKAHDDYDQAEQSFLSHPLVRVDVFKELLLDADNPAELAYYLGKNQEELDKIGEMSKEKAARYMGRLEEKIQTSLVQSKKAVTNAPKPISPLSGAKGATTHKDPNDMTMDEFVAWSKANQK